MEIAFQCLADQNEQRCREDFKAAEIYRHGTTSWIT
jgi:hypothetical protein